MANGLNSLTKGYFMKANEFAHFEKELLEFARGVEKSSKSFFKIFYIISKIILSLVKAPVLKKQISPGRFEDFESRNNHIPKIPGSLD